MDCRNANALTAINCARYLREQQGGVHLDDHSYSLLIKSSAQQPLIETLFETLYFTVPSSRDS